MGSRQSDDGMTTADLSKSVNGIGATVPRVTVETRMLFSVGAYPERAIICNCSRHRHLGQFCLTIFFERQAVSNLP
ncbi:MAG: hypothetical protein WBG50_18475 [Desulfomonilaceae bacterium]